jgi:glycine cleavage system H protein
MDAGVLAFRLCDRGFACERCPLDAALRGDPRVQIMENGPEPRSIAEWAFPADRLYTAGHLWVQPVRAGRLRTGLDAAASRLLGVVQAVLIEPGAAHRACGDGFATLALEGGPLSLGMPVAGRVRRTNEALEETPGLLTADPYDAGWLAEIDAAAPAWPVGLMKGPVAAEQAAMDWRIACRRAAFRLLAVASGPELPHPGSAGALARLLGPARSRELAVEFVR